MHRAKAAQLTGDMKTAQTILESLLEVWLLMGVLLPNLVYLLEMQLLYAFHALFCRGIRCGDLTVGLHPVVAQLAHQG